MRAIAPLAVVLAAAVAAFAIYTFGWHRESGRREPSTGLLAPSRAPTGSLGQRLYLLREGDVVRLPGTATDCLATGEAGQPELFCTHTRRSRFQVVFTPDGVSLFDLARHGEPMVPTFFVPGELKRGHE